MLSKQFLLKQKQCCGKGCLMCPYIPRHKQGSSKIMNQLGYACINMHLSQQKPKVYTGRSMIKRTLLRKVSTMHPSLVYKILKTCLLLLSGTMRMGLSSFVLHPTSSPGVVNTS